jgi:uncharacterized protein (TIGR04255 family)
MGRSVPDADAREQLPNAALIEVACEIRFHGDLSLLALQGKVQGRLRGLYPKLLVPTVEMGNFPLLQQVRFTSADDVHIVLMAVNSFGVSTRAYTKYADFRQRFETALQTLTAEFDIPQLTRFGLRFVNVLPPLLNPGAQSAVHPALKMTVSGVKGAWRAQPQVVLETDRGRMTLRTLLVQPPPVTTAPGFLLDPGIRLDFDCYVKDPGTGDVLGLMDEAHDIIDDTFFDIITPAYLSYLRGHS